MGLRTKIAIGAFLGLEAITAACGSNGRVSPFVATPQEATATPPPIVTQVPRSLTPEAFGLSTPTLKAAPTPDLVATVTSHEAWNNTLSKANNNLVAAVASYEARNDAWMKVNADLLTTVASYMALTDALNKTNAELRAELMRGKLQATPTPTAIPRPPTPTPKRVPTATPTPTPKPTPTLDIPSGITTIRYISSANSSGHKEVNGYNIKACFTPTTHMSLEAITVDGFYIPPGQAYFTQAHIRNQTEWMDGRARYETGNSQSTTELTFPLKRNYLSGGANDLNPGETYVVNFELTLKKIPPVYIDGFNLITDTSSSFSVNSAPPKFSTSNEGLITTGTCEKNVVIHSYAFSRNGPSQKEFGPFAQNIKPAVNMAVVATTR